MKVLHKLNQIKNPKDLWLLLRIAVVGSFLPLGLRLLKFPALLKRLRPPSQKATAESEQVEKAICFVNFVLSNNRLVGRSTCLKRSLLLYYFLRRAGLDVEINIGVIKEAGQLVGHSWLTCNGKPYLEKEEVADNYKVIYSSGGM